MSRILLVEDNDLSRDMLSRRLRRRGFEVLEAGDGEEALAIAARERPDLVLMDLSLPGMDGWQAAARLRADASTRLLPIIALSAHALSSDRDRALAAGCDDFDTKPVDLPRLLDKIGALLPGAARRLDLAEARLDDLALVRDFVARACQEAGASQDTSWALTLAVDEICSNIVLHGYRAAGHGPISVEFDRQGEAAVLTITDRAVAFDPADARAPDLSLPAEERAVGGLGWAFVRQVVDRLAYTRTDDGRNQVTLFKSLKGPPVPAE